MKDKIKITGTLLFTTAFIISFLFKSLRENIVLILCMISGLVIAAVGFYIEEKEKSKNKNKDSIIFYNGKIHTFDKKNRIQSAVFIKGGKIVEVGNYNSIVKRYDLRANRKINLEGKTVIPGLIDSHMHMYLYGESLQTLDLRDVKSVDEMIGLGQIAVKDNEYNENKWLKGRGWNQELFSDGKFPTIQDMDKISVDIPIVFTRACCHISVVNSKAIELMNIKNDTFVEGGEIEKDIHGNLTGMFKENAVSLINNAQQKPGSEEIMKTLETAQDKLLTFGLTGIQTDDLQHTGSNWDEVVKSYVNLNKQEKLILRINQQCLFFNIEEFRDFISRGAHGINLDNRFKTGPLKLLGDGSLGARTAFLSEPYSDEPSQKGITAYTQQQLDEFVDTAHKNGISVAIHAIGDKMMDMAFDAIKLSRRTNKKKSTRDGIVHCQITTESSFKSFSELNVSAYIQPVFTVGDWKVVEKRVGKERSRLSYNWKRFYDMGIMASLGTDSPVESPNPFENIYAAVTRKDFEGKPDDGWFPDQKLTVEQAVRGYTVNSAYMSNEENIKGTIEKGKLGDLVILSDDIFTVEPEKIKDIHAVMTIIDGKIVYDSKQSN